MKNKTRLIVAGVAAGVVTISVIAGVLTYKYSEPTPDNTAVTQEFMKSNYRKYWWESKTDLVNNYQTAMNNAVAVLPDKLYTGHKVYLDAENKPFIISGDSVMYLSQNISGLLRPIDKINLREEYSGTKIRIFSNQEEISGWKKINNVENGNTTINEYKTINVALEVNEDAKYVEALPIFDEVGATYTRDSKTLTVNYKPINGAELKFAIPIGTKGTDFTDMATKSVCKVAFIQDTKLMLDVQVLQQLFGFEATVDNIGGQELLSVVSDYADIQVPVLFSKTAKVNLGQYYKKKSDGTFDTVIFTATNSSNSNVSSGSPNPASSVGSASSKPDSSTSSKPVSGSKQVTSKPVSTVSQKVQTPAAKPSDEGKTGKVSVVEAYGGAITATWVDGSIVSEIAHTCVGDVDIVTAQGDGNYASMLVGKLFRKVHPGWKVSESSNGCGYVRPPNDMGSTFEDVEDFCNGDPNNIRKMSQEQLYQLSPIIRDMGGLDIAKYETEFRRAWSSRMAWVFADTSQY